jgi:hypothetical protein
LVCFIAVRRFLKIRPEATSLIERIQSALDELEVPFEEFERGGFPATQELFNALLAVAIHFALIDKIAGAVRQPQPTSEPPAVKCN